MNKSFYLLIVYLLFIQNSFAQNQVEPFMREPILQFAKVRDLALSSSGKEAYVTVQSPLEEVSQIVRFEKKKGEWSAGELLSFSSQYKDMEPFLSADDLRLYFVSDRPKTDMDSTTDDFDIWYVDRESRQAPWSEPINMGASINTAYGEFYPSVADNYNLYFTRDSPETMGKDDIFFAAWQGDHYALPVPLDSAINSVGYEYNAFIAADESYLIFGAYNREDGLGSGDLYISYRQSNGSWSLAENMGSEVNSAAMDYCPFVDVKNQNLYFTSRRSKVKSASYQGMQELLSELNQYENGTSRLYSISIDAWMKK